MYIKKKFLLANYESRQLQAKFKLEREDLVQQILKLKEENLSAEKIAQEKISELQDANQERIQELNMKLSDAIQTKNLEIRKKDDQIKQLVIEKDRVQQSQIQEKCNAENVQSTDRAQIKNLESLLAAESQALRLIRQELGEAKSTITQINIQMKNDVERMRKEYQDNDRELKEQLSQKEREKQVLLHQKELGYQNQQSQLQGKLKLQNIEIEKLRCEKERLSLFQKETLSNANAIKHQSEEKIKDLMNQHHSELKVKVATVTQMQSRINELELELKLHQEAAKNLKLTIQDKDKEIVEKQIQIEKFYKRRQVNDINKEQITKLNQKMKSINQKEIEMDKLNKNLQQQLKNKERQCSGLRTQLHQMKQRIFKISLKSGHGDNRSPQNQNLFRQTISSFGGRINNNQQALGGMVNTIGSMGKESSFQKHQKEYFQAMENLGDDDFLRQSIGDEEKFNSMNKAMLQKFEKQQQSEHYKPNLQSYEQLQGIQKLVQENRELKQANSQMMRQIQEITQLLQQQTQKNNSVDTAENISLRRKNEELNNLLSAAQESLIIAKDNQLQREKDIAQYEKRIEHLQNENTKVKQQRDKMAIISTDLRSDHRILQNQLAQKMNQLQYQKQQIKELRDYALKVENQLKKLKDFQSTRHNAMFGQDKLYIEGERVNMAEKQEELYRPNSAKATRGQLLSQLQMKKKQDQAAAIKQMPVLETVKLRAEKAAWKKQQD